jgi:SH3 domain-binding protein 5 (SH3BP5)
METEIQKAKSDYNEALQSLEKISDEIHKLREDQKLSSFNDNVGNFKLIFSIVFVKKILKKLISL